MAQDAGENVLPNRFNLGAGRKLDDRFAIFTIHGGASYCAQHVAHRALFVRVKDAGPDKAGQIDGGGFKR